MDPLASSDSSDARESRARDLVSSLYDGLTDSHETPMFEHMKRVAENCPPRTKVLGWLHDVVEDGLFPLGELEREISLSADESEALELLTRNPSTDYASYINRLATSRRPAGVLAREVKIADLRANLDRPPHPERSDLRARYAAALRRLCD